MINPVYKIIYTQWMMWSILCWLYLPPKIFPGTFCELGWPGSSGHFLKKKICLTRDSNTMASRPTGKHASLIVLQWLLGQISLLYPHVKKLENYFKRKKVWLERNFRENLKFNNLKREKNMNKKCLKMHANVNYGYHVQCLLDCGINA